jgi:hypothetical protein
MLAVSPGSYKPSHFVILWQKTIRFLKVGWMLHFTASLSLVFFFRISQLVYAGFIENGLSLTLFLWTYIAGFFLSISLISEKDAYGRYQNYKQVKDLMHIYGFQKRLLKPFMLSRCQRNAACVAAKDLKLEKEVKMYIASLGYLWYHIFPDAFIANPQVLFKRVFWERILFTKYYKLHYFYW